MTVRTVAPDPSTFPRPKFATWVMGRTPQFKQHSSLGLAKSAISTRKLRNRYPNGPQNQIEGGYIYRWDEDSRDWSEFAYIERGTDHKDHHLWRGQYSIQELP